MKTTIEERAIKHAQNFCECLTCCGAPHYCKCRWYKDAYENYIKIATEQDRISREHEREKFFRACCDTCYAKLGSTQCKEECERLRKIRKAMEGGEG